MRKTIAKAVTWRLIGTAEIFAISFWTTGHIATAGHTAGIAAIASFLTYVAHELAWNGSFSREGGEVVEPLAETARHDPSEGGRWEMIRGRGMVSLLELRLVPERRDIG
jgi:uncharacterized membrane protein